MLKYVASKPISGPQVTQLQSALITLGYDLGKYGADGIFGEDTAVAVKRFQRLNRLGADGIVGPATWKMLDVLLDEAVQRASASTSGLPACFVDRRGLHAHPPLYSAKRSPRGWDAIEGVTLHQTGCVLSNRPQRWDTLNAHIGITRDGHVILCNELTDFIWHAQGLSHRTIGIEYAGNFPGVMGGTTWAGGGGPSVLTPAQLTATDALFAWLQQIFEANGAEWKVVRAHRQSYKNRRADPGEEIWKRVARIWSAQLGIAPDNKWTSGTGRPIPSIWGGALGEEY